MQTLHPAAATTPASDTLATPAMRWAQSDDVVTHAANLSGWQQQYDQLSGGAFCGQLAEVWFDEVQVFRERTSRALRQICRIRPDAVWCGLTTAPDGSRIEGHQVGAGGVMVSGSGADFELATPDNHDILGIVASRGALEAVSRAVGQPLDPNTLGRPTWLACDPPPPARSCSGDSGCCWAMPRPMGTAMITRRRGGWRSTRSWRRCSRCWPARRPTTANA